MANVKAIDYYHFGDVVKKLDTLANEVGVVIDVQKHEGENGQVVVVYQGNLHASVGSPFEFEIIGKSALSRMSGFH